MRGAASVVGLAAATRLAMVLWAWERIPAAADGTYYHRLAQRLAAGEGYTWLWPDGVVTAAAHYPVGYPALLAGPYALFGAHPGWAMLVNALLGTLGCLAIFGALRRRFGPRSAWLGGVLAALHPGLVGYTPALMTEGVVACLWAGCLYLGGEASRRERRLAWLVAAGVLLGVATLVRPQSLLLAPVLGAVVLPRGFRIASRGAVAVLCTAITLAVCLPWTMRNCREMGRCALVSVNGGWNLLIGTDPAGQGGWAPLKVPPSCVEVFDEAGKDACFRDAAVARIRSAPGAWLAMAPAKLGVTFDYCGAPGWYLREANGEAFGDGAKVALGVIETVYERLLLLLALFGSWVVLRRAWPKVATSLLAVGALSTVTPFGWPAWIALGLLAGLSWRRRPMLGGLGGAAILGLVAVHAAFFGAGRYQLMLSLLVVALAAPGARLLPRWLRQLRRSRR